MSDTITGLSASTDYRVRGFAINSVGTGYGATVDCVTDSPTVPKTMGIDSANIGKIMGVDAANISTVIGVEG